MSTDLDYGATQRVIASGQVALVAATTTTLGPFTRNANERLQVELFITDNVAGATWSEVPIIILAAGDVVSYHFERTVNADEFNLLIRNNNAVSARTIDWVIYGTTIT